MEDLLEKRIIASLATNTTLNGLLREVQPFTWTQGKPPIGKLLDTPGGFVWIIRELPYINAQGSVLFHDYEVALRISLGNRTSVKPLKLNSDGTFKDFQDEQHTANREAKAIRKAILYVLETVGFDNNWYYDFVQQGVLGEVNRINLNYEDVGGVGDAPNLFAQYLTGVFVVRCWSESSVQIAKGDTSITVTEGGSALSGATVTFTDKMGNTIWESDGTVQWTTNGSGVITTTDMVAQNGVNIIATKSSSGTRKESSKTIPNGGTLTDTIEFGTNSFPFTTAYADVDNDPDWTLGAGSGDVDTTETDALYLTPSSNIYSSGR